MFDLEFWKNLLLNSLATFAGAFFGIPIALWINRSQQKASESNKQRNIQIEASARRAKILQLIKDELVWNKSLLEGIHESKKDIFFFERREYELLYQLKTELWSTFSDGGELQWIQDINMLHVMAQTYDSFYVVNRSENMYTRFVLDASVQYGDSGEWTQYIQLHEKRLFTRMHESINSALENIENALKMIDQEILSNVSQGVSH
ncbi:MAG TPA: hypothetical protein PKK96_08955 [Anaerolineales bacterium]|nr:hypothetical protein [Anaerolineales bacterium]HNS61118.1 hypothetical protein [Anaerolineales bacterium]